MRVYGVLVWTPTLASGEINGDREVNQRDMQQTDECNHGSRGVTREGSCVQSFAALLSARFALAELAAAEYHSTNVAAHSERHGIVSC